MARICRTIIFLFFCTLISLPGQVRAQKPMTIAFPNFYPFFEETDSGGVRGFFYDIIILAVDTRLGIPTQWEAMPWQRCQAYVKAGRFDAMITVPTAERQTYTQTHPDPFYLKELKLFTYAGHPRLDEIRAIGTIRDILDKGLTVITYRGNGWHHKKVAGIGVSTIETWPVHNVWRMLSSRRGDLVIEWPAGAYAGMAKVDAGQRIVEIDVSLDAMPFHLLISKKSGFVSILPEFNRIMGELKANGTIGQILLNYH